ncbi:MAG: hypothetical protein ABIW46_05680, partial [Acidimicrobiales bacterium]
MARITRPRRTAALAAAMATAASLLIAPGPGGAQVSGAPVPATLPLPAGAKAEGMTLVGHSDLGGLGLNGDVAVVGTTAVVGSGYTLPFNNSPAVLGITISPPCVTPPVHVVDIGDPTRPRVVGTIAVPRGQAARDIDALHVSTPAFTGDLVAIAFTTCQYDLQSFREVRQIVGPASYAHRGVAYYDVSEPARPRLLGRYLADSDNFDPAAPPCAPMAGGGEGSCARDQFSVQLKQIRDGRILSLSTNPDSAARANPTSETRIVDVTDPTRPVQLGSWPPLSSVPPRTSNNGCYPRSATRSSRFSPDGTKVLVPYLDGGLFVLDVSDLGAPAVLGQWKYPDDFAVEGNAADVAPAEVGGRQLSLVAEEDIDWRTSSFRLDSPAGLAGTSAGCSHTFTTFDPTFRAQVDRQPGGQLAGELVYVGRGCPDQLNPDNTILAADVYLGDPRGKIAYADRGACTFARRTRRALDAG